MKWNVLNLEFPDWCKAINIDGYQFNRVEEYSDRINSLQHLVSIHSEHSKEAKYGTHAITAVVENHSHEKPILEWGERGMAIQDVVLLLSLFTQRDVLLAKPGVEAGDAVLWPHDPGRFIWGGTLTSALPQIWIKVKESTRYPDLEFIQVNVGLEAGLSDIYKLMRTHDWQERYKNGYLLILAQEAFRERRLESAFTQCWTLWEHLFSILNEAWLSEDQVRRVGAVEKISFILVHYALQPRLNDASRKRIGDLAAIRNKLIHHGRFPGRDKVREDAELFIRMTEFVVAKILGLSPTKNDIFETIAKLERFLQEQRKHEVRRP